MSDITASERRLSAALDRLDKLLEAGAHAPTPAEAEGPAAGQAAFGDLQARLEAATEQSAQLSAANEDLIAANRDMLDAQATGGIGADEARAALEAEIAALRAARAAEMAQMSEIMAELERLLAGDAASDEGEAPLAVHAAAEAAGDDAGLPEAPTGEAPASEAPTPKDEERKDG
ncbi:hypothetical protein PANO111632_11010 [Paracoccus nototheniae]|uniref:Uncharacterized protein n=1 Tax=Paracoccus nototheniae TaxID=2489002 RepID=A0ABW4E3L5_9RHOB|nr:hypothetical protein [Paracoccus nototheniae]